MKQRPGFAILVLLFTVVASALSAGESAPQSAQAPVRIVIFGDSLTAGYGLDQLSDAYPAQLDDLLKADGLDAKVVNAGLSGETTAGGLSRIGWILRQPVDIFLIELGANDFLRGLPLDQTEANLRAMIQKAREAHPKATVGLLGMEAPPNLGADYTAKFAAIYARLSKELGVPLFPFLLKDVGGDPDLNQADGMHPNAQGAKIVAGNLRPWVEGLVKDRDDQRQR